MINIIIIILLLFFLVVAGLLLIPFYLSLYFFKEGSRIEGSLRISWLGIPFIRRKIPQEEKKKSKEKESFEWRSLLEDTSQIIESFPHFVNFFNALMKSIFIQNLFFKVVLGLNSAADTAVLSGYLWSVASIVNIYPPAYLFVKPDFQEERLDLSITAEMKIRLLRIVFSALRLFSKKPVRQMLRTIRR